MNEANASPLRVETLKAIHFSMLSSNSKAIKLKWLQAMLLRNWVAQAEKNLPGLLPSKQPFCLVAIEKELLIALVVVQPVNRRGSCWSVTLPQFLESPNTITPRCVSEQLLQSSLQLGSSQAQSWITRCPANDSDQLAIARELGFQPLKLFKAWEPDPQLKQPDNSQALKSLNSDIEWQALKSSNAISLWSLQQTNESGHLRQILDRQSKDLLNKHQEHSKVLISKSSSSNTAIAGLICRSNSQDNIVFELVRDLAWDTRLKTAVPIILNYLRKNFKNISIETSSEDDQLTNLLNEITWEEKGESILLGRTLWRRQLNNKLKPATRSLESMLGRLQPQTPPLPTPSIGPR